MCGGIADIYDCLNENPQCWCNLHGVTQSVAHQSLNALQVVLFDHLLTTVQIFVQPLLYL